MIYALDYSFIIQLHKHYYRESFPSMWRLFDDMVSANAFTSTREVFRELEDSGDAAAKWAEANSVLFTTRNAVEGAFVAGIYAVPHFQANIEKQKLLKGGKNADPFVIARAHAVRGTVLTMEQLKPHAAKIPNICRHFKIQSLDLRNFMLAEGWKF